MASNKRRMSNLSGAQLYFLGIKTEAASPGPLSLISAPWKRERKYLNKLTRKQERGWHLVAKDFQLTKQ